MLIDASHTDPVAAPVSTRRTEPGRASLSLVALGHEELAGYPLLRAQVVVVHGGTGPALEATERMLVALAHQLDAANDDGAGDHEVVVVDATAAAAAQRAAAIIERLRARGIAARLGDDVRTPDPARALDGLYPGVAERDRIVAALQACRGNQTRAAAILGMSRRTLIHRLERYALPRPRKPPGHKG